MTLILKHNNHPAAEYLMRARNSKPLFLSNFAILPAHCAVAVR